MTNFKQGDRVRVTFEATYDAPGTFTGHYFKGGVGEFGRIHAPDSATIELVTPALPEEPPVGTVVKITDGHGSATAAVRQPEFDPDDDGPWYIAGHVYGYTWETLHRNYTVEILTTVPRIFREGDPEPKGVTVVREIPEEDGHTEDTWRKRADGTWSPDGYSSIRRPWGEMLSEYGPVVEVR